MTDGLPRVTLTPDTTYSPAAPHSVRCLNCDTPLSGPFCHTCGQRDIPPYPSTRELVVDAFWELSGWDGRFAATARALVRNPGLLTREFLEGRRARYLSPLRLYLLASLAYFLVAAATPQLRVNGKTKDDIQIGARANSRPARVVGAAEISIQRPGTLTGDEKARALKDLEKAPPLMRPFLRKAVGDPQGFRRGILEALPRLLFGLLPVFAGIVALFYRGRKYPEHLYFAIHLHAFVFVAMTLSALTKFTHYVPLTVVASVLVAITVPVYATLAFRRVYGGSIGRTLAKEVAIGTIYAIVSLIALLVTVYWVAVMA
jgi:hypothetical protein